ncbi:MAG: tetratricopeptide repeat protein [Candidatus Sumerlaeaceae bacterium]|nr:tetratricopeptide repeat protein [Candidatus Sumerlaeaceae bacterium]
MASNPKSRTIRREAQRYLDGIADPDSTPGLTILYDRAINFRVSRVGMNREIWEMSSFIGRAEKQAFSAFIRDESVPLRERAQMRYRLAFAHHEVGNHKTAFDMAGEILSDQNLTGVTRHQCLWLRAMLFFRTGKYDESADLWRQLISENPQGDVLRPAYLEYSQSQEFGGDVFGAALTLEELRIRFPACKQAELAAGRLAEIRFENPIMARDLDQQRPILAAKWKRTAPPGSEPPEVAKGQRPAPTDDPVASLTELNGTPLPGGAE